MFYRLGLGQFRRWFLLPILLSILALQAPFHNYNSALMGVATPKEASNNVVFTRQGFSPHVDDDKSDTVEITTVDVVKFKPQGGSPDSIRGVAGTIRSLFRPEITVRSHVAMNVTELPLLSNLLIVTRGSLNVPEVGRHLKQLRSDNVHNKPMLVGLLEMADELNTSGNARYYGLFDYVIRNYYFPSLLGAPPSMYVRALGNLTCGTATAYGENWANSSNYGEQKPILYQENQEPWLGVHWFTNEEDPPLNTSHVIPSSKRKLDCSFVGSLRSHRREMVKVFQNSSCVIEVEKRFRGNVPRDQYLQKFVAQTKITLAPWGNNHESIRTAEALNYGSIPLLITNTSNPHEYINKFFRPIPALYAASWKEARGVVEDVVANWEAKRLDELQIEAMKWKIDYQRCKWNDMYQIMSRGLAHVGSAIVNSSGVVVQR
ncbi:hypothetical protein ACHAW6_015240 [Cyclotella cf. meneghiniana]